MAGKYQKKRWRKKRILPVWLLLLLVLLTTGGIGTTVAKYIQTNDLADVDLVKRDIIALYEEDFEKIFGAQLHHRGSGRYITLPSCSSTRFFF